MKTTEHYSSGRFSRVYFLHTARRGLRTFTHRVHREDDKGTQLAVISNTFAGGPTFNERFVDTDSLRAAKD